MRSGSYVQCSPPIILCSVCSSPWLLYEDAVPHIVTTTILTSTSLSPIAWETWHVHVVLFCTHMRMINRLYLQCYTLTCKVLCDWFHFLLTEPSRIYSSEGWETQVKCYLDDRATVSNFFSSRVHMLGFWVSSTSESSFAGDIHLNICSPCLWNGRKQRCVECEFIRLVEKLWGSWFSTGNALMAKTLFSWAFG